MKQTIKQLEAQIISLQKLNANYLNIMQMRTQTINEQKQRIFELQNFAKQLDHQIESIRQIVRMTFHSRVPLTDETQNTFGISSDGGNWEKQV